MSELCVPISVVTCSCVASVPVAFGRDNVLSAVGSVTASVVSYAFAVAPSNTKLTPGLKLRTQWSSATLFKRATNTWVVYGDLTA